MIRKLLVANRGEIAVRVMRSCKTLGIGTVAVYATPDATLPHVCMADEAVHLGAAPARESYLNIAKVIQAARDSGADAIHPGYGFLSENPAFAEACDAAGLIFVGPSAASMRLMGDKAAARQHMQQHRVPVLPGFDEENAGDEALLSAAHQVGFPLLIKAVAGGGGKGMRVVTAAEDFAEALAAARREARNAFGDDRILLERFLPRARHVEVQVFADSQGQAVHLFERDCSVQRRHQKIIEEAPAPGIDAALRASLGEAAVKAALSIDYRGAGTVEFLLAPDNQFYFMEMNTRLQVEHPVTEMITGEDLVAWQLAIAAGQPLPKTQSELTIQGHAMEVRVYAEDPDRGFLPSSGELDVLRWAESANVRIDSGFAQGDGISDHYDPMLAKVIAWGRDRDQARRTLSDALARTCIGGIHHNLGFLVSCLDHPAFCRADLSTRFLEEQSVDTANSLSVTEQLAAAALIWRDQQRQSLTSADPWDQLQGWRGSLAPVFTARLGVGGTNHCVMVRGHDNSRLEVLVDESSLALAWQPRAAGGILEHDGRRLAVQGSLEKDVFYLFHRGHVSCFSLHPTTVSADDQRQAAAFAAPMSGTIVSCHVAPGSQVAAGTAVITLEAMKMEHTLRAPTDGTVTSIACQPGDTVTEGTLLVEFSTEEDA